MWVLKSTYYKIVRLSRLRKFTSKESLKGKKKPKKLQINIVALSSITTLLKRRI